MSPQVWLVVLIITVSLTTFSQTKDVLLIDRVYESLDNVLTFVMHHPKQLNLDALYGIVLGQVHLDALLNKEISFKDKRRIARLKYKADTGAKLVNLYLDNKDNILLRKMLIPSRWVNNIYFKSGSLDLMYEPRITKYNVDTEKGFLSYLLDTKLNESHSDFCIGEVLKTQITPQKHDCHISRVCDGMVNEIDPAYGVCHSLLLLQTARTQNCLMEENSYKSKVKLFCSYILWEVQQNMNFYFLNVLDDLLLEQITLCGREGFEEFFHRMLIERTMEMQTDEGCFTVIDEAKNRRQKRVANTIAHGCNDHSTGLGVSTLSLQLLYLHREASAMNYY